MRRFIGLVLVLATTACAGTNVSPVKPHMAAISPSVQGGLKPAQIEASFVNNMPEIERIATTYWPGAGKVQVSFVVQPDGLPDSVQLVRNDFHNADLDVAITRMVQTMSFPSARSATYVKAFPVYFE